MMKSVQSLLKGRSTEVYLLLVLLWILPGLVLIVFGLIHLFNAGWLLWFGAGITVVAVVTLVLRVFLRKGEAATAEKLVHLKPMPDWSENDHDMWDRALTQIGDKHLHTLPWEAVPKAMLNQITFVAQQYNKDDPDAEFAFSVPELLLMLEVCSREYRGHVLQHVPLSQSIKVSTLRGLNRKAESLQKIYKFGGPVVTLLRAGLDPTGALASEIRSRLFSELSGGVGEHMQKNMKQMLFEQVTQVAIDLYSGRLKLDEAELETYRRAQKPPQQPVVRPLSVIFVGQVNAGKSSLVNHLKQQCVAEVDALPSTLGFNHYHMVMADGLEIYLIDTPGLDGSIKASGLLLEQTAQADLVLWVCQANQPAKGLDKQFMEQFNAYFTNNKSRKKPPVVLVSTHNDMLFSGQGWNPPYDLTNAADSHALTMLEALNYTYAAIGFPASSPMLPTSLAPDCEPYNLDALAQTLIAISSEARAAQLSRERLDAANSASIVMRGLGQVTGLVKLGVGAALR